MATPGVAFQLYTVREDLAKDFVGTLKSVAAIGYRAVELVDYYGTYGLSSSDLKGLLADLSLTPMGIHIRTQSLDERFDEAVGYYQDAGVSEFIVPGLPRECYADPEGFRRGGAWLQQVAGRILERGVGLSYHNHHHDFKRYGDQFGLDLIFGDSKPEDIGLEADVYWISYAGCDPAAIIQKYANRCRFVHLKDRPAGVDLTVEHENEDHSRMFAEVGEGVIDWPAVFAAAEATPARWYVVEQDASLRPSLESAAISFRHLQEWGKV